jgi:hypothetical protein
MKSLIDSVAIAGRVRRVCALFFLIIYLCIAGCSPQVLRLPAGAQNSSALNKSALITSLDNGNWLQFGTDFYGINGVYDYRLPDVIIYQNENHFWNSGSFYKGYSAEESNAAQELSEERFIWALLVSADNPIKLLEDQTNTPLVLGHDAKIADTLNYKIKRTALAYTKPLGERGLLGLISSIVSVIPGASTVSQAISPAFTPIPDQEFVPQWRRVKCGIDGKDIYVAQVRFDISPGTVDRITVVPAIIGATSPAGKPEPTSAVDDQSNLLFSNTTFVDADGSWLSASVGIGSNGKTPDELFRTPVNRAYAFCDLYLQRPALPLDNRSFGLAFGLGITPNVFDHIIAAGQVSISQLVDWLQIPFLLPLNGLRYLLKYPISWRRGYTGWPGSIRIVGGGEFEPKLKGQVFLGLSYDLL